MDDRIKHHLDRNTAWGILNEGGVENIRLNTPNEREESVRKFLALGKKSESLFTLLSVSKHDALRRDVVAKLAEKNCTRAMETFQQAPDDFKGTILEEVLSLAAVMPSNEPIRKGFRIDSLSSILSHLLFLIILIMSTRENQLSEPLKEIRSSLF